MSLNPEIRDQAYQFFIEEAGELLQVLEDGLVTLKEDHSTSKVHELMRAAHSLKGGAASVELDTIKLIAHRLEDFFKALYSDQVNFDNQLESLFLKAFDGLRDPLVEQMEQGEFDEEEALLNVAPVFDELEEILGEALKEADSYIPSATDLGVDIVESIFDIDVQQSLEHLVSVTNNPSLFDIAQELQAQLEVLSGFAELFNLPGFGEIIELGTIAVSTAPQRALEITQIVIDDCQQSRELVLAGDRAQGGSPSPALILISRGESTESELNSTELTADELTNADENILDVFGSIEVADSNTVDIAESSEPAEAIEDLFGNDFTANTVSGKEKIDDMTLSRIFSHEGLFGESESANSASMDSEEEAYFSEDGVNWQDDEAMVWSEAEENVENLSEDQSVFSNFAEDEKDAVIDWGDISSEDPNSQSNEAGDVAILDNLGLSENIFEDIPDHDSVDDSEAKVLALGAKILDGKVAPSSSEFSTDFTDNLDEVISFEKELVNTELEADKEEDPIISEDIQQSQVKLEVEESSTFTAPENLENALNSIPEIFEQLPSADADQILKSGLSKSVEALAQKANRSKSKAKSAKKAPLGNQLSVRVDLDRLERMNNLIGELVINRNSLALQNEQLQLNVKNLSKKFIRFRTVTSKLREISDRMLVESESSIDKSFSPENTEFDSLEMDSYNLLQLALQDILEEIAQLEEGADDIFLFAKQSSQTVANQSQMLGQMRDELMWARMLPLEQILKRFPRTLKNLSNEHNKPVELDLIGTSVLVDKAVLEKLYDPLLHLLRNGFDHGIEPSSIRKAQGKPEVGKISIHAYYQGNQTVIEISDDGKGLDTSKIIQKAVEKGLVSADDIASFSQEQVFDLIFEPGFSTSEKVSEISGRGIGMNVVKEQIEFLKGRISVASTPGQGSVFTLSLPLTLTIAKLLVVSLGETAFALPSDGIEEIIVPKSDQIKLAGGQKYLHWNGNLVSIYNLKEILEYNCTIIPIDNNSKVFASVNAPQDWAFPLLLLRRGKKFFALEINRLITEQELVVKPFGKTLTPPSYTYGCTILGDGTLIPVINGVSLIQDFLGDSDSVASSGRSQPQLNLAVETLGSDLAAPLDVNQSKVDETVADQKTFKSDNYQQVIDKSTASISVKTIMVVDDSTALRRTMALSLERKGYRIIQAKDGRDALEQLRQNSGVDLIVCDVEMPHMNGFEFLGVRRRDSALKEIPVIMLTSRSGIKHRNLAGQLGADGYFTKPYVEVDFLKELSKILNGKVASQPPKRSPSQARKLDHKDIILIVDDSSALRRTMALSLERKGYHVLEARDGEEGLEQMNQNPNIGLVICDIEMPKMNGFDLLRARQKNSHLQKIPVAMLTSRNSEKHQNVAFELGANAYFTKPYVEDPFIAAIKKLIKKDTVNVF